MSGLEAESRTLDSRERELVSAARKKAFLLYEGRVVGHRSCGIALAETFNLKTPAYQSLRRGGITGEGYCGSIRAGEMILGELLGDPDPAGPVTDPLRRAVNWYQRQVPLRIDPKQSPDYVCNNLTRQHGEFTGDERASFCTELTAEIAALTAEALLRFEPEIALAIEPVPESEEGEEPSA